jgi:hypothetical protein
MKYNQNHKISQIAENTLVVGVDIAKKKHYARAFDFRGMELDKVIKFKANGGGFESFINWTESVAKAHGKNGVPVKAKDGVSVGKWRTFVKGINIDTFGLGGDSAIRFDKDGHLLMEPTRLIPLSIAAEKWPVINYKLCELINTKKRHTLLLHEFFFLMKEISNSANYNETERNFCEALKSCYIISSL